MTNEHHPNYVPKYHTTPELLDQMYAQSVERDMQKIAADRRAQEWPIQVEQLLGSLVRNVQALQARVAALEAGKG